MAKYQRKALLIISDGGDNRSRYTEGELTPAVRESEVQIYSIGIFDMFAPTEEERRTGRNCCAIFRKPPVAGCSGRRFAGPVDVAQKISQELRNEYVIGYTPTDTKRDGTWRKVKVAIGSAAGSSGADGAQSRGLLCTVAVKCGDSDCLLAALTAGAWAQTPGGCAAAGPKAVTQLTVDADPVPSPDPDNAPTTAPRSGGCG